MSGVAAEVYKISYTYSNIENIEIQKMFKIRLNKCFRRLEKRLQGSQFKKW